MRSRIVHLCTVLIAIPLILLGQNERPVLIKNTNGEPIANVHVFNKKYSVSLFSDQEGIVILPIASNLDTLIFSGMGYKTIFLHWNEIFSSLEAQIELVPLSTELGEIVVFGRAEESSVANHARVEQIGTEEIQFEQAQTAADVLEKSGDVFVQKSQFGGGSPIIRGFEANRVLLVVDGVRMNNLIYRSGHLQNAITIDPMILSGIEVIFGPGSLSYGSDALGGVVHYKTKDPMLKFDHDKAWGVNGYLRTATANFEKRIHVDFDYGNEKWATLSSITYSDYDDLRTGRKYDQQFPDFGKRQYYVDIEGNQDRIIANDDPNLQVGTGYSQLDLLQKVKFQPTKTFCQILNVQYSTSSDIPRYDQLSSFDETPQDFAWAEWYYGPQKRAFISTKSDWKPANAGIFDHAWLILGYQNIEEDRISRRFRSQNRFFQEEDIDVWSATIDFKKNFAKSELRYGVEANSNHLHSTGSVEPRNGGPRDPAASRYPDGKNNQTSFGVYARYAATIGSYLFVNGGLRYSAIRNEIQYSRFGIFEWPEDFYSGVRNANQAITWVGSISYQRDGWTIQSQSGTAFRAPNIDDLAKIRVKGDFSNVPNLKLIPETSWNVDLLIKKAWLNNKAWIQLSGFYTTLEDAIIQDRFRLPNGDSILFFDREPYLLVANVNAEEAYVLGTSISSQLPLEEQLLLSGSITYTYGRAKLNESTRPLAHIPPVYGKIKLEYINNQWTIAGIMRFNGRKRLEDFAPDSSDNLEFATPEGSLAWVTYNLYSEFDISNEFSLQLAIENITDLHYRTFSSGVSAPGRNFIFSVLASI